MKKIKLKGKLGKRLETLVDDEDYTKLILHNWYVNKGYAISVDSKKNGGKITKLHRKILGITDPKKIVDHIDGNTLNNQKHNLRIVDYRGNNLNKKCRPNMCGFRGVYLKRNRKKYEANIMIDKKFIYLGTYAKIEDAIKARLDYENKLGLQIRR